MSPNQNPKQPVDHIHPPIKPTWCLLDHPEIWNKLAIPKEHETELLSDAIFRSKRLTDLSKSQKNEITHLPNDSLIKPYLTCSICNEIPFPRKGNHKKLHNGDPFPYTVYLCKNGHPVCRECAQSFKTCMFEKPYVETQLNSKLTEEDYYEVDSIIETQMSMTSWNSVHLCNAPIDKTENEHDFFLADVIEDTEFSCRYYYDGCGFQGTGKGLHDHEKCHVESVRKVELEDSGDKHETRRNDDGAILSYNHSDAVAKADKLIRGVLGGANRSHIDLNSVPRSVLEGYLKDARNGGGRKKRY